MALFYSEVYTTLIRGKKTDANYWGNSKYSWSVGTLPPPSGYVWSCLWQFSQSRDDVDTRYQDTEKELQ
jgi:hypothetical protein